MITARFKLTLADGSHVVGAVQGAGGVITDLERLQRAIRLAERGRPTGIYEPRPTHCRVFTDYGNEGNGPHVDVDLYGATATRAA